MILFRLMMMTLRPNVYANPTKPNKVVSHGRVFLLEIIKKAKGPIKFYFHGLTKEGNFFPSSFFLWKSADFRSAQNYASSRGGGRKKSLAFAQLPFKYISTTKGVSFSFWGSLVYARKECQRGGNGLKICVFYIFFRALQPAIIGRHLCGSISLLSTVTVNNWRRRCCYSFYLFADDLAFCEMGCPIDCDCSAWWVWPQSVAPIVCWWGW